MGQRNTELLEMAQGRVKWFDNRKGYGFIQQDSGEDVFVHYRHITGEGFKTLETGDLVEFDLAKGDKGMYAVNVRRAAAAM